MTHTRTETNEERTVRLVQGALAQARKVQEVTPSRYNSLTVTELEMALHWAALDVQTKSR